MVSSLCRYRRAVLIAGKGLNELVPLDRRQVVLDGAGEVHGAERAARGGATDDGTGTAVARFLLSVTLYVYAHTWDDTCRCVGCMGGWLAYTRG